MLNLKWRENNQDYGGVAGLFLRKERLNRVKIPFATENESCSGISRTGNFSEWI